MWLPVMLFAVHCSCRLEALMLESSWVCCGGGDEPLMMGPVDNFSLVSLSHSTLTKMTLRDCLIASVAVDRVPASQHEGDCAVNGQQLDV